LSEFCPWFGDFSETSIDDGGAVDLSADAKTLDAKEDPDQAEAVLIANEPVAATEVLPPTSLSPSSSSSALSASSIPPDVAEPAVPVKETPAKPAVSKPAASKPAQSEYLPPYKM